MLAASTGGGMSRAIEEQEANGQSELVRSEMVPTEIRGCTDDDLRAMGFVLGEPEESDAVFRQASLPAGWKKVRTDHSMWSKIVDAQGRERFSIFYKAAFYDRSAFMDACRRFTYSCYEDGSAPTRRMTVIKDGDTIIETIGERETPDHATCDAHRKKCEDWLNERYPDWLNPLAYWD